MCAMETPSCVAMAAAGAAGPVVFLPDFAGQSSGGAFVPVDTPAGLVAWLDQDALLVDDLTASLLGDSHELSDCDLDGLFQVEVLPAHAPLRSRAECAGPAGVAPSPKRPRLAALIPTIPHLVPVRGEDLKAPMDDRPGEPAPPGGRAGELNLFTFDSAAVQRRRGGLSAREYRRTRAIPKFLEKRTRRDWNRQPMYESRTHAASSRQRVGGRFTSAPVAAKWQAVTQVRREPEE